MIQNEEFIREFVEEALSHLEMIEGELLKMDEGSNDDESINNIFRSIHSVKGTAGFFGLEKIVELAHAMEHLLGEVRSGNVAPNAIMVDHLLRGNDQLKYMVGDVYNSDSEDISEYVIIFTALLNEEKTPENMEDAPETNENALEPETSSDPVSSFKELMPILNDGEKLQEQISKARKHGHNLYKVTIGINRDLGEQNISPVKFFKKIQSVGEIVDSYIDISQVKGLDNVMQADAFFTFVFTTVLEKKLLPIALDINEENFEVMETYEKEMQKNALLSPDEYPEEYPEENLEENQKKNQKDSEVKNQEKNDQMKQTGFDKAMGTTKPVETGAKKELTVTGEDSVRVQVSLLNDLLDLASEMVLGRNQLLRNIADHRKEIHGLDPILQNINRITTELQEKIMQTRMQPVGNVFNKMPRVVRDLSKKLGKEVKLTIEGSHVELDKSIIESLSDPLTHLIRNAVDHGMETPDSRKAAGKPEYGNVLLKAYHDGGYVHIDIVDDGAGINQEKIKAKGLERKLVTEKELMKMSEQDILQLLMSPGFSTAEKVTDVSGRGVGMDVVKTNIEKLGGTIEIKTVPGEGTTFRMILPLTLAIIPSLIVEVNDYRFALPQVNLQEMVRIKAGDESKKIEYVHNAQVLRLRGKLLPVVHLGEVLGLGQKETNLAISTRKVTYVLVLKVGSRQFGLVVDKIHDEEEILVKPLPVYFKSCQCYSGVTIMGDGKTAMILDPDGIIHKARLRFTEEKPQQNRHDAQKSDDGEMQNMFLFKCSGEETFAIDLSFVARVEEIRPSQIETIGDKEYIPYQGDALQVVQPENYLPVTRKDNRNAEKLYVIIPKQVTKPIGLIIEKIYDTMMTTITLNKEEIRGKGLIGSTILGHRIVLLINMHELFEMVLPESH